MKTPHTQRLWAIEYAETKMRWPVIVDPSEEYDDGSHVEICEISKSWPVDSEGTAEQIEAEAIARLIVVAPELLAACSSMLKMITDAEWTQAQRLACIMGAKAAIAKATTE